MRKWRRREVTVETAELWVIRRPRAIIAWCPECGAQVQMITPDEAAVLTDLTAREIYSWVEAGLIHYLEMPGGFVVVCLDSIVKLAREKADLDETHS